MSKVDPVELNKLDRRSTILLQASRRDTELAEKSLSGIEDPGMDALRGSFGTVGSIIRARSAKRMSMSMAQRGSLAPGLRHNTPSQESSDVPGLGAFQRHQLYDPPVPRLTRDQSYMSDISLSSNPTTSLHGNTTSGTPRTPTIKFDEQDVAHYYPQPGGKGGPVHELLQRPAMGGQRISGPLPPIPPPSPEPRASAASPKTISEEEATTPRQLRTLPDRVVHTAPASETRFFSQPSRDPFVTQAKPVGPTISPVLEEKSPPTSRGRKAPHRNYPRSGGEEDREESIGLVNREALFGASSDSISAPDDESGVSGVRLVTSSNTRI